jgi:two-component system response regulator NreC
VVQYDLASQNFLWPREGEPVYPRTQIQESKKIRCVLAHGLVLLRQGLRRLLEDEPDMKVVAEAGNAAEALHRIFEHRPEVVIADAHIFECPSDQMEQLIVQECPNSKVLFLTNQEGGEPAQAPAPGNSYAVRQTSAEELVKMVRETAATGNATSEVPAIESVNVPEEEVIPRQRALTTREHEVLRLLAQGRTVRSAAGILGLSIKTVDAHKFNLMRKLGIHNKAELVMWAIQKRVVELPAGS